MCYAVTQYCDMQWHATLCHAKATIQWLQRYQYCVDLVIYSAALCCPVLSNTTHDLVRYVAQ